jgi:hypothetical protein
MFPTAIQTAVSSHLLSEAASSASLQHTVFWVYGSLGVFALACLGAGYLVSRIVDRADARFLA